MVAITVVATTAVVTTAVGASHTDRRFIALRTTAGAISVRLTPAVALRWSISAVKPLVSRAAPGVFGATTSGLTAVAAPIFKWEAATLIRRITTRREVLPGADEWTTISN